MNQEENKYSFDISFIKKTFGDDKESLLDLIKTFIDITPESLKQMIISLNNEDYNEIAYIAHKMIPGISFFGLKEIEEKLVNIEKIAKNKQECDSLKKMIKETNETLEEFINFLKKEFKI